MKKIENKYLLFYVLFVFYKKLISPLLGNVCRFTPSCSEYYIQSIYQNGIIKGHILTFARLLHCNPFYKGGFDSPRKNATIKECIYLIFKYKNNEK